MKSLLPFASLLAGCLALNSSSFAGTIIVSSYVESVVFQDVFTSGEFDSLSPSSLPAHDLVDATVGSSYSRVQVDYIQSAGGETFSYGLTQNREGAKFDLTRGLGLIEFTVDANTTYELSGYFNVTDVGSSSSSYVELISDFYDVTSGYSYVSSFKQTSTNTQNETFTLGGSGGDQHNNNFGSLSGNLVAGHTYEFSYQAFNYAYTDDEGSTAVGNITLKIGSGGALATVPEPASFTLWSLGVVGMTLARYRRDS